MSEKYIKNERHLSLVTHSFTKLSQNVCLIDTHILMYRHARCDCKLWNTLWFYCDFWVFSYITDEHSYLKWFDCLTNVFFLFFSNLLEWPLCLNNSKCSHNKHLEVLICQRDMLRWALQFLAQLCMKLNPKTKIH